MQQWTVSTLATLSTGEVICLGFTMETNQDWLVEYFRPILFPSDSVSEEETR